MFVPAAVLALGVASISGIREQLAMTPRAPIASLDREIAGSRSVDVTVPPEEQKVAGMSQYVMRNFGPDSAPLFTIYVGYYDRQVQGKSIHSPKNCLPGAGWEIMQTDRRVLPGGASGQTINRVLLANKGVRALVYYWYQGRGRVEASEYKVKWNLMRDAALYGRTEESLVRIVVPLASGTSATELDRADLLASTVATTLSARVAAIMPPSPGA